MESSLHKAWIDSATLALGLRNDSGSIPERFRYDSAEIPLRFRDSFCVEICMKSFGCMESSLNKASMDSARLFFMIQERFRNDSGTIPLRFR